MAQGCADAYCAIGPIPHMFLIYSHNTAEILKQYVRSQQKIFAVWVVHIFRVAFWTFF